MGNFCVADGVTRLDITADTPVVGFLVAPGRNYPHTDNPAAAPVEATDLYQLVSLPIFGTYDEAGGLNIADEPQLSVQLALLQTASESWEELQQKVIHAHSKTFQLCGEPDEERHYGIFIVQRPVYEKLCAMHFYEDQKSGVPPESRRKQDVEAVLAAFAQHLKMMSNPPLPRSEAQRDLIFQTLQVTSLSASSWTDEAGTEHELPRLARIRDANIGFGPDFWTALRKMNLVSRALLPGVLTSEIEEMLNQLWDTARFLRALNLFNIIVTPTLRSGQNSDAGAAFELGMLCMQDAWEHWEFWLKDYVINAADVLRPRVAEVKALAHRMESFLATLE